MKTYSKKNKSTKRFALDFPSNFGVAVDDAFQQGKGRGNPPPSSDFPTVDADELQLKEKSRVSKLCTENDNKSTPHDRNVIGSSTEQIRFPKIASITSEIEIEASLDAPIVEIIIKSSNKETKDLRKDRPFRNSLDALIDSTLHEECHQPPLKKSRISKMQTADKSPQKKITSPMVKKTLSPKKYYNSSESPEKNEENGEDLFTTKKAIIPLTQTVNNKMTYGRERSYLMTTAQMSDNYKPLHARNREEGLESSDEDTSMVNSKNVNEMREAGVLKRFTDGMQYLVDGLKSSNTSIRRNSLFELTRKLVSDQFVKQIKMHDYMSKLYPLLVNHTDHISIALSIFSTHALSLDKFNVEFLARQSSLPTFLLQAIQEKDAFQVLPHSKYEKRFKMLDVINFLEKVTNLSKERITTHHFIINICHKLSQSSSLVDPEILLFIVKTSAEKMNLFFNDSTDVDLECCLDILERVTHKKSVFEADFLSCVCAFTTKIEHDSTVLILLKFLVKLTHWHALSDYKKEFSDRKFIRAIVRLIEREDAILEGQDNESNSRVFDISLLAIGYLFNLSSNIQIQIEKNEFDTLKKCYQRHSKQMDDIPESKVLAAYLAMLVVQFSMTCRFKLNKNESSSMRMILKEYVDFGQAVRRDLRRESMDTVFFDTVTNQVVDQEELTRKQSIGREEEMIQKLLDFLD